GAGRRAVEVDFSAGKVSSDGGALLLKEADRRAGLTERMAGCFVDHRRADLIEHSVRELIAQRVYGLVLGYEDLNDHESLSGDPVLSRVIGKQDPEGRERPGKGRGKGLASASPLGRVERPPAEANETSRYEKVVCDFDALRRVFVQ